MIQLFRSDAQSQKCVRISGDDIFKQADDLRATTDKLWIDLCNPSASEESFVFDQILSIHSLTLEDVTREKRDSQHHPHLPKVEEFADYLFVIVNPLHPRVKNSKRGGGEVRNRHGTTQLSALMTQTRLVTYHVEQLRAIDELTSFLERHPHQGERGPDFLFHIVLDAMVDEYAPTLDQLIDTLEGLETQILKRPEPALMHRLLHLKREIIVLRKTLVYEREVLARLSRGEFAMIDERETVYYRNVYDHLVRFTELVENAREMCSDLMECHLSATSNRLNEIMKVLAMISTIVLPMSLIAGIYGMNFRHMPEIEWPWGYAWGMGLMALAGLIPLAFFKWRRWF
jgi:magnesium transporter